MPYLSRKKIIWAAVLFFLMRFGWGIYYAATHLSKTTIALESMAVVEKAIQWLPVENDIKTAAESANAIAQDMLKSDEVVRTYLVLLQNNMELRPGGGFLGQYAIVKMKNGNVENLFIEDANLLNQRISAKIIPPYPFKRMLSMKKWKFSDSNFSPDFPTNVEKAQYFYRLSGGGQKFDGVFAINADVLNAVLEITGPVQVPGYNVTFQSEDASIKLEELVEKAYLGDDIPAEVKEQRKNIMKKLGGAIVEKLISLNNVSKIIVFAREQLEKKNVMLYFKDGNLQKSVLKAHWDGSVSQDWNDDYLMVVDANMGALKSDYYMRRSIRYEVDLTGEKPMATVTFKRAHTASSGNWRTSDYHSYLRLYVPAGSKLVENKNVGAPITRDEFNKTYFGFIMHTRIGEENEGIVKYELPEKFRNMKDYRLLFQKQSGVNDMPVDVSVKTPQGVFHQQNTLVKDLKYEFQKPN